MQRLGPPLWEHQKKALEMGRRMPDLALFFDMGTGKTRTAIELVRERCAAQNRLMRVLVLCPLIVVRNWCEEFKKFSKITDVYPLIGPGKGRETDFLRYATEKDTLTRPGIFISNYESQEMEGLCKLLKSWSPEILICDESHRLKNFQSKRAKGVVKLLGENYDAEGNPTRGIQHVYLLTGSPILNTPLDIYNQYRILDSGKTFGTNFYQFRGTYFDDLNRGMPSQRYFPDWCPRPEAFEELNSKIYRKAIRVMKKDCLDLPPLVRTPVYVELGKEQRRLYDEMKEEYITWVKHKLEEEPKAVVAQLAVTKALRLQQIVSGFVKTDEGQEIELEDNPRLDALAELIGDIAPEHKLIVWATFHRNYKMIANVCKELKVEYAELHGGINANEKYANVEKFRGDSACRLMLANQGAGGVGINLVEYKQLVAEGAASYSIFYSKNFSLEHDIQAEARNYRGGSEVYSSVVRLDLIAQNTIDELISEALQNKQNMADKILDWKL